MASLMCEAHIWSLRNQYAIPDDVIGFHCLHDKGEYLSQSEQPYSQEKQKYIEGRDIVWTPRNKRPERLRDTIKEIEELLSQYNCVQIRWRSRQVLQIVLSNASIIVFTLSGHCGDIERVYIDKTFVGKLSSEMICDAYVNEQFFVASHSNMTKLDFAYFTKRPPLNEAIKRMDKLSSWEPKFTHLDIPGPKGRRLERHFSMNITQDMMLVWWSLESGEAWPWSPMNNDKERSNMIVISINGPLVDVIAYTKTECDLHHAQFSTTQPHRIFSLEQQLSGKEEIIARSCTYEIIQGKIIVASIVNIPLKSTIVCQKRNPSENRLLLGLSDATLVMYDNLRKTTLFTRASIPPALIVWHPNGSLFVVASARADIQIFDRALLPLRVHLVSEDPHPEKFLRISKYFRTSVTLKDLDWCPFAPYSSEFMENNMEALFLSFSRGPVGILQFHSGVRSPERFSCIQLVEEYLKHQQIDEAVSLLGSMNWDMEGQACYTCLSAIINHLLRMTLNSEREAQLQATLATFYASKPPISEATILEYRDPISQLARRFFQHLLRYLRFDKAFLLAVDIGARDLFMDIHYMAIDKGETALADVAKKKAEQIESDGLDTLQGFDDGTFLFSNPDLENNNSNASQRVPSSKHPWQFDEYSTLQQAQESNQNNMSSTTPEFVDGGFPDLSDLNIHDHFISDYTAALMDPTPNRAPEPEQSNEEERHQREGDGKVKVIHFGIV